MPKIWQSKSTTLHPAIEQYTVGNDYILDQELLPFDVEASFAHAQALKKIGVITAAELKKLQTGLKEINALHMKQKFEIKLSDEDCHTAIENYLIKKYGSLGKKIHTGRSRNDQVLVTTRLFTRAKLKEISRELIKLERVFLRFARRYQKLPLPGYTHTRRAMPSSVAHWAASYLEEAINNYALLESAYEFNNQNPLGAAAGFGVNFKLDRKLTTKLLKFKKTQINSLYCVNSRGLIENHILSVMSQIMMMLGRLAQEMIWFTTPELNFFHLPQAFTTGSSIMPQKRNPDVFEIMRSNVSVVISLQSQVRDICKNSISGYNRDTQLTKEPLIKGLSIVRTSLAVAALTLSHITPNKTVLQYSLTPEMFANHEANKLVKEGMPFRDAYQQVKEHLDDLTSLDSVTAIQEINSLGGPGNLALNMYTINKPL